LPTTSQIRKEIKANGQITPIIDNVLEEMRRIESIRNNLFKECRTGDLFSKYTNKAGATNIVVNPAVKEYKAYCQQFNNLVKTLDGLLGNPKPKDTPKEPDALERIQSRYQQK